MLEVKTYLHRQFTIKDLGYTKFFLGLEVTRSHSGLYLYQKKYILEILKDVGLQDANPAPTPMIKGHKLLPDMGKKLEDVEIYRRLVSRLLYLSFIKIIFL